MWCDGRRFVHPTIAQIDSGIISVSSFNIHAVRHNEQEAVFVVIECHQNKTAMVGIGCSGYSDPTFDLAKHFGINEDDWNNLHMFSASGRDGPTVGIYALKGDKLTRFETKDNGEYEPKWIGVTKKTLEAFYKWLEEEIIQNTVLLDTDFIEKCKANGEKRFNQGDKYFAEHINADLSDIGTKVGESDVPIAMKIIGNGD